MPSKSKFLLGLFLVLTVLTACQPDWEISLVTENQSAGLISSEDVALYIEKSEEEIEAVPLEQFLYLNGFFLVKEIILNEEKQNTIINWEEFADDIEITTKGQVLINNVIYKPDSIEIIPSNENQTISYSIIDIAPTMAHVLGWPDLPDAEGTIKYQASADQGVMIFLDGLQYNKLEEMISLGQLPFLSSVDQINRGLSVYPPITTAASAAILTGATPQSNGVYGYGYRSTDLMTLFDLAAETGNTAIAIEGASLPFNLRNAETTLSGDRDGNGFSDDNVFQNSLEVIQSRMPALLYIHFHEIDDAGHSYGPESLAYQDAIMRVDSYLEGIINALPPHTFIIIFADHGMHAEEEGGTHGNLIESDMIVPIIFIEK